MYKPHIFGLILFIYVTNERAKSFLLIRGKIDRFTNPRCNGPSSCLKTCSRYFARCVTSSCEYCICDEHFTTYVAFEGRCVSDNTISRLSGIVLLNSLNINDIISSINERKLYTYIHKTAVKARQLDSSSVG